MENEVNRSACMQCQIKCIILAPLLAPPLNALILLKKNWADMTERASELVMAILAR